jgi:hypothetical protein
MRRSSFRSSCSGEKPNCWIFVGPVITIGSPRRSPVNLPRIASFVSSASVSETSTPDSGLTTIPGTPMLRRIAAVKVAASLSVKTSRSTEASGEQPRRPSCESIP